MKYSIVIICFFAGVATCLSQDTITYFNEYREKVCCKDSAFITRIGKYDQGIYDGDIVDYYPSGKICMEGAYSNWIPNGFYKWYFKNGKKMCAGSYLKHSDNEFEISSGWDSLGNKTVKNGMGYFKWYNSYNGKVSAEGKYFQGKRDSLWIFYNIDGTKIEETIYKAGVPTVVNMWDQKTGTRQLVKDGNGELIDYYKNGQLKYQGVYKSGEKEGEWVWFFYDGKTRVTGEYSKGKANGKLAYYYDNGKVRKEGIMKDGKWNGPCTWYYTDGKISCKGGYTNGEQSGLWIWYNTEGTEKSRWDYQTGNK
jgi:antitoxin component YwqK of YwqJK toxin-antitoxin module